MLTQWNVFSNGNNLGYHHSTEAEQKERKKRHLNMNTRRRLLGRLYSTVALRDKHTADNETQANRQKHEVAASVRSFSFIV